MKKLSVILLLLFCSTTIFAQSTFKISYNESIHLNRIDEKTVFTVSMGKTVSQLKGNEINNFIFKTPGAYIIKVQAPENHEHIDNCQHSILPEKITVIVSPFRVKFDEKTISFSDVIHKNQDTKGISLNITVTVETFNNKPAIMSTNPVKTAGIGTQIVAELDNKFAKLKVGTHIITYHLSGIAKQNAFIMFDFVAPNGNIQPVSLLKPIEN